MTKESNQAIVRKQKLIETQQGRQGSETLQTCRYITRDSLSRFTMFRMRCTMKVLLFLFIVTTIEGKRQQQQQQQQHWTHNNLNRTTSNDHHYNHHPNTDNSGNSNHNNKHIKNDFRDLKNHNNKDLNNHHDTIYNSYHHNHHNGTDHNNNMCLQHNSCIKCLSEVSADCFWCAETKQCDTYIWHHDFLEPTNCHFNEWHYNHCYVQEIMFVIVITVLALLLLISMCFFTYYCHKARRLNRQSTRQLHETDVNGHDIELLNDGTISSTTSKSSKSSCYGNNCGRMYGKLA